MQKVGIVGETKFERRHEMTWQEKYINNNAIKRIEQKIAERKELLRAERLLVAAIVVMVAAGVGCIRHIIEVLP